MGFYPQAVDIDSDGLVDIVGGSYNGNIVYYKKTKNGFEPRKEIEQLTDLESKDYSEFVFTNCTFGDYNKDGLLDAFVGGNRGFRYMLNVGTKSEPKLDKRKPLMQTDGKRIKLYEMGEDAKKFLIKCRGEGGDIADPKSCVVFIDWDNDGVEDLLVTTSYTDPQLHAVTFYKGVKKDEEFIFEDGIPLFESTDGQRAIPGTELYLCVMDVNGDGILDILIGSSIYYDTEKEIMLREYSYNFGKFPRDIVYKRGFITVMFGGEAYK